MASAVRPCPVCPTAAGGTRWPPTAAEAWAPGDPRFGHQSDPCHIAELLVALGPLSPSQAAVRRAMLTFHAEHPADCHQRTCLAGHFTGSAMLVDAAGQRVLLTHHRKLDRWLQLGGHADGNANLRAVALREAQEESGITDLRLLPHAIDLDIHTIPARGGEPEHLHLDVRFLVAAPPDANPAASEESHDLRWLTPDEARALGIDDSVGRLLDLLFP